MFICLQYKIEKKEESEEEDEDDDMMMSKKKVEEVDPIARESCFLSIHQKQISWMSK